MSDQSLQNMVRDSETILILKHELAAVTELAERYRLKTLSQDATIADVTLEAIMSHSPLPPNGARRI